MRVIITISLTFAASIALVLFFAVWSIQPGDLSSAHQDINDDCLKCHDLILGAADDKCIDCHSLDKIGSASTASPQLSNPDSLGSRFHQYLEETDCMACHALHADKRSQQPTQLFQHELLTDSFEQQCLLCHEDSRPLDEVHQLADENCGACHLSGTWTGAVFEHKLLPTSLQGSCTSCHQENIPPDNLHQLTSENCGACHSTATWSNAQFEHDQFSFDRNHPSTCSNCHTVANDYSQYTCYSCHEHSASEIRGEHLEEGIRDYQDCVSCHQSGSEHVDRGEHDDDDDREHDDDDDDDDREHDDDDDDDDR